MNRRRASEDSQIIEGKVFAILSYLSIFCILPLVLKKENPFVLSHGKQGLVLFVGEVGVFIVHIILGQWFLRLGMFIAGIFSLVGIIKVLQSEYVRLPIIADIADKITL
ncbi:MAG TPA: hypothetical protein VI749_00495 [Candidatus Omnitrophota bacterium]|nr:hypothetical protein [Candidatus Omnitrophota bacterium]